MTADQIEPSSVSNLEVIKQNSQELRFSGDVENEGENYQFIAQFKGTGLDTNKDPIIYEYNIYDGNMDLKLSIFDFNYKFSELERMLANGVDSPEFLSGSDVIYGDKGNDVLTGFRGADEIWGDEGNDVIRAGNGADVISGDYGSDILYGGFGKNIFEWEDDGAVDELYLKSDQWAYNYIYDSAGNNPNGAKADTIYSLDTFDKIFVQGVSTSDLSFAEVNGGIGIFAGGYLEATYTGGDLSTQQLQSMTSGVAA